MGGAENGTEKDDQIMDITGVNQWMSREAKKGEAQTGDKERRSQGNRVSEPRRVGMWFKECGVGERQHLNVHPPRVPEAIFMRRHKELFRHHVKQRRNCVCVVSWLIGDFQVEGGLATEKT